MKSLRLGTGAGYAGDRISPAVDLARQGELDFLVFECLAERTVASAQLARARDPLLGYDPLLEKRMRAVLPICTENRTRIISNMGAANPRQAGTLVARIAAELGIRDLRIAVIEGDDVLDRMPPGTKILERDVDFASIAPSVVSANAYLGAMPILDALEKGADVVITGRVADPSLFVAPILHHFGWSLDDWHRVGQATLAGHLLECGAQVSGGYFADEPYKSVPALERVGLPIGTVHQSGQLEITKLSGTGGMISPATCKEQLLYEVFDPACYLTPDVRADFSNVSMAAIGDDRVIVDGATGRSAPPTLKVSIGYRAGFLAEAQISYAGGGARDRARLALDVVRARLARRLPDVEPRFDLLGCDALVPMRVEPSELVEATARIAAVCETAEAARSVGEEMESLYVNGPAGGGGVRMSNEELIAICSALIDRETLSPTVTFI